MTEAYGVLVERARQHQRVLESRPLIRVGTGMCGQAVGAVEVVEALRREVARQGLDATVMEVGCLGLCYAEPLVDVQFPGSPRVFY